ncbi:hypothetical protein GCM10028808_48810 [Spirosoma migulaei]
MLIIGGAMDNQAPPIRGQASIKKYNTSVISDFKLFDGRGNSLILDSGWKEIA